MAKKLFFLCATLAFCVLLTNASIYRTIVEFDEDDITNPHRQGGQGGSQSPQRCQQEFQQSQQLQSCRQYIQQQMRQGGGGGGYGPYDELDFEVENPHGSQQRPRQLQQCCQELQQQDPVCVCPNLQRVAAQAVRFQGQGQQGQQGQGPYGQGQQGQQGQHQVRQIFQTARNLPQVCKIRQVGVCPFQSSPYYY